MQILHLYVKQSNIFNARKHYSLTFDFVYDFDHHLEQQW